MPFSSTEASGKNYEDLELQLRKAGFSNVTTEAVSDLVVGFFNSEGDVEEISVDGKTDFTTSDSFDADARIVIRFHAYPEDTDSDTTEQTAEADTTSTDNNADEQTTVETPEETEDAEPAVSQEYLNAVVKAQSYSDNMYMSKQGIYDQLTSEYGEGFSKAAAKYALKHIKADYKKNALVKAKSYYEDMNMSKNAVYDQLISKYGEQFTKKQAKYAIKHLDD
jgi:hypothetical protein